MFDAAGNLYYDTEDPRTGMYIVSTIRSCVHIDAAAAAASVPLLQQSQQLTPPPPAPNPLVRWTLLATCSTNLWTKTARCAGARRIPCRVPAGHEAGSAGVASVSPAVLSGGPNPAE